MIDLIFCKVDQRVFLEEPSVNRFAYLLEEIHYFLYLTLSLGRQVPYNRDFIYRLGAWTETITDYRTSLNYRIIFIYSCRYKVSKIMNTLISIFLETIMPENFSLKSLINDF